MDYEFLSSSIEKDNILLPDSDKINPFLLKNNYGEIVKAIDFIASEDKFLYLHGFIGTGKRQFINYVCDFLNKDVITLEYYCKEATVCDDILLTFTEFINSLSISKAININAKIATLNVKFQQQITSIKKPFLIILHSFDDILEENQKLVKESLNNIAKENNVKIILSTRAMIPDILGELQEDKRIFLKSFSKEIFKEFLVSNQINATERTIEDFYKYTRGYYYYTALTVKILQAMKIELSEFLQKFNQAEMSFDSYLGFTYINLIPTTIRNFFWFLRTIRHGLTLNALAIIEVYDEFAIEYLKSNLMIFQADETIYVQDYFLQKIDISIPEKTEIKLHKYIIGIYEEQLKSQIKDRIILISRQALRAEIDYHTSQIEELENNLTNKPKKITPTETVLAQIENTINDSTIEGKIQKGIDFTKNKKYTEAIEIFREVLETENIDLRTLIEARLNLGKLYKTIEENKLAIHYFELVETYYKQHNENINLNYLYYDLTDLYYKTYKNNRAIETIKKVIYSVDTPQSLMVNACTLLGNIYSETNNPEEAYSYYKKALESLDDNVEKSILADLFFKYALANDDKGNTIEAFEYYNKCIAIKSENPYKAPSYSNIASCYLDNENYDDAKFCFLQAYNIEKSTNNYDGIYYNASKLAQIYISENSNEALNYLTEAKSSAEFINDELYILEASIALGDYYYNNPQTSKEALKEYLKAHSIGQKYTRDVDITKIEKRINDMKLRMDEDDFNRIASTYAK